MGKLFLMESMCVMGDTTRFPSVSFLNKGSGVIVWHGGNSAIHGSAEGRRQAEELPAFHRSAQGQGVCTRHARGACRQPGSEANGDTEGLRDGRRGAGETRFVSALSQIAF